ncbi:conserved hypothetical protein [Candidatus Sulfopaludibacter sp. SbA3]|nr:conserved hypothetical protein [Candidatus Sulfopaludibacter sp. SbA3]
MAEDEYCADCASGTAVTRGCDFTHRGCCYQVKANRPSGRKDSFVTLVGKANNYDWAKLVWILYDRCYQIQEAWEWTVDEYRRQFETVGRLSPAHMRLGRRLFPLRPACSAPRTARPAATWNSWTFSGNTARRPRRTCMHSGGGSCTPS